MGTVLLFVLAAAAFVVFPLTEYRAADPMMPPSMMRNRQLMLALAGNGFAAPALFLVFLYMPQYLHKVLGWTDLWAAVGVLPTLVSLAALNVTVGRLYNSVGPRRLLTLGHMLVVLGVVWLALLEPGWGYLGAIAPMVMVGVGGGCIFGPAGTACVNAVEPSRAGLAGGLGFMGHLTFGAIGVGIATAVLFVTSNGSFLSGLLAGGITMPDEDIAVLQGVAVRSSEVRGVLAHYDAAAQAKITAAMSNAFADGFQLAFWIALAFAALGLVLCLRLDDRKLGRVIAAT